MGFVGVYKAIYDYEPQAEGELQIKAGDLLYVLEKSEEDDWWKVKKRAASDEDDEPTGLVPMTYIEEAEPISQARAVYEYTRQTDEELSFPEEANLEVFDTTDPEWILVGLDGEYGFVPANYIDLDGSAPAAQAEEDDYEPVPSPAPALPQRPKAEVTSRDESPPSQNSDDYVTVGPAAALAGVLAGRAARSAPEPASAPAPPPALPPRQTYDEPSEEEDNAPPPALPSRPKSDDYSPPPREPRQARTPPPQTRASRGDYDEGRPAMLSPGGFHMYNINEMVSVMGKKKKMPTTLGINLKTGIIMIAPERESDGPTQEWTVDRMTHYSVEGKHVFLDLVRPSKSVDFHAGAKDTAEEIVAALGEMAGLLKVEGLHEEILHGNEKGGQKRGTMLYEFMAQGDDEVTVAAGDDVIVLDDSPGQEWWKVRRVKNGKEGVVPASYVEIVHRPSAASAALAVPRGLSTKDHVELNRREEARLAKEAIRNNPLPQDEEIGPGMRLPERNSSLGGQDSGGPSRQRKRENGDGKNKSKPDLNKVRVWTDRTASFSVEAQFLGLKDGKINLHKMNGVKIAVPLSKMSEADLEYVERETGTPLTSRSKSAKKSAPPEGSKVGATVEPPPKKPDYDWFEFFLSCDVPYGLCERYAQAFARDSFDESVLPDVNAEALRRVGLKEGDVIKVMRFLDNKYGRNKGKSASDGNGEDAGGLFSTTGGALKNNTGRGRPTPTTKVSDVVDGKVLSQQRDGEGPSADSSSKGDSGDKSAKGFDDDAWNVKPSKAESAPPPAPVEKKPTPPPAQPPPPQVTGALKDLSLLTQPLEPTRAEPPRQQVAAPAITQPAAPAQPPQMPGATPSFFSNIAPQTTGYTGSPLGGVGLADSGVGGASIARQRPLPPQQTAVPGGALLPPPPVRPLSAPLAAQQSQFAAPRVVPQITGTAYHGQPAPPGQSLAEIGQARLQAQYTAAQQMPMNIMVGNPTMQLGPQQPGIMGPIMPMVTGIPPQQLPPQQLPPQQFAPLQQPMQTGYAQPMQPMATGYGVPLGPSPFADPRGQQFSPIQAQQTAMGPGPVPGQGLNSVLPPPLIPQPTAFVPQQQQPPPLQALAPQPTGPAPQVKFGMTDAKKLVPTPTGRRANLSQASPSNPFGF